MTTYTVNDNAGGIWATRIGTELELVGPGQNSKHVIVKRPGERKTFGMVTAWLDPVQDPITRRSLKRTKGML